MKKITGRYDRVFIVWDDSTSWKKVWWQMLDIFDNIKDIEKADYMYTVAYLFHQTKRNYYLANSIHFEEGKPVSMGQIFTIPKGCVRTLKKI